MVRYDIVCSQLESQLGEATRQFEGERSEHKLQKEKLETELAQLHTKLNAAKQVRKASSWEGMRVGW